MTSFIALTTKAVLGDDMDDGDSGDDLGEQGEEVRLSAKDQIALLRRSNEQVLKQLLELQRYTGQGVDGEDAQPQSLVQELVKERDQLKADLKTMATTVRRSAQLLKEAESREKHGNLRAEYHKSVAKDTKAELTLAKAEVTALRKALYGKAPAPAPAPPAPNAASTSTSLPKSPRAESRSPRAERQRSEVKDGLEGLAGTTDMREKQKSLPHTTAVDAAFAAASNEPRQASPIFIRDSASPNDPRLVPPRRESSDPRRESSDPRLAVTKSEASESPAQEAAASAPATDRTEIAVPPPSVPLEPKSGLGVTIPDITAPLTAVPASAKASKKRKSSTMFESDDEEDIPLAKSLHRSYSDSGSAATIATQPLAGPYDGDARSSPSTTHDSWQPRQRIKPMSDKVILNPQAARQFFELHRMKLWCLHDECSSIGRFSVDFAGEKRTLLFKCDVCGRKKVWANCITGWTGLQPPKNRPTETT